jgi:tRNA-dihydrouridine synthase 3
MTSQGLECSKTNCRWDHDLLAFLASRLEDIPIVLPLDIEDISVTDSKPRICPHFLAFGQCGFGFKCRFAVSHMLRVEDGKGLLGSDWTLVIDQEKIDQLEATKGEGLMELSARREMNLVTPDEVKLLRGVGLPLEERFPLSNAYLVSIGEPLDTRELGGGRAEKGGKNDKKGKGKGKEAAIEAVDAPPMYVVVDDYDDDVDMAANTSVSSIVDIPILIPAGDLSTSTPNAERNIDLDLSRAFVPDLAPIRATEKKLLDFRNKLWLAPLTTVGNLPFRRLCGDYGNDISTSEMGLSQGMPSFLSVLIYFH